MILTWQDLTVKIYHWLVGSAVKGIIESCNLTYSPQR